VLLREDIFDIVRLASASGFRVWLESNGRLLSNPKLSKQLSRLPIAGFFIKLFSHDENLHTYATGERLAFRETIEGIANLQKLKFKLIVKLIIIRENLRSLAQTFEFLARSGLKHVQLYFPESIPERYAELEQLVPQIPEAVPHINLALSKAAELGVRLEPRFTPFSLQAYKSAWVKQGKRTSSSHKLLFDNGKNLEGAPALCVVIPTFNRSEILHNTLMSLMHQTLPPDQFEVIVVDDGSTDKTLDMIKGLNPCFRLRYILQDDLGYGPGRARNLGTLFAEGEIVLFIDADVISDPENLKEHLTSHAYFKRQFNHDAFVIGKRLDMHTSPAIQKLLTPDTIAKNFELIRQIPARPDMREDFYKWCNDDPSAFHSPWHMVYTNNVSVRRKHLLAMGLLDESFVFWGIEDQELGYRLQWLRFVLNPRAVGYHQHHELSYSDSQGLSRALKYNARIFYKKYLDPKLFETYKPSLYHKSCCLQITPNTLSNSEVFKYLGRKPAAELSLEQLLKQAELYLLEGCDEVELIGGNPLLHPAFWKLLPALTAFSSIRLETEADSLADLKTCLRLLEAGVDSFLFTYGGSAQHEALFSSPVALVEKAIKNLRLLRQEFRVRLVITKHNFPQLEAEIERLYSIGVRGIELSLPLSFGNHRHLFDESGLPLSGLLYYHIFRGLRLAKAKGMDISTRNVFSDFLGLNANIFMRLYELFRKPVALSRDELR
jgi:glycosyltransferase involved in cell wall biosynthesis